MLSKPAERNGENRSVFVGRRRFMSQAQCQEIIDGLCAIPEQMETVLKQSELVKDIATQFCERENWLFLGRGYVDGEVQKRRPGLHVCETRLRPRVRPRRPPR